MEGVLTLEKLKAMAPGTMFATGKMFDTPNGLFMANTGKLLRWVAVRGGIHDWTIYCHFASSDAEWIRRYGNKVYGKEHIKMCVPCNDEAFAMYRY